MAAVQVKTMATQIIDGEVVYVDKSEWLIASADDLAGIPAVAPGSVAYKADGSLIYTWDGTDWVQWGGAGNG